jgi:membrane fusion protein (multidrug efflux system)
MKASSSLTVLLSLLTLSLSACNNHKEEHHEEEHKITATVPERKTVTVTQRYVCQIHSQRHIQVRALERGYLEAIPIREGQAVKAGDVIFTILPVLYQAKLDAEMAEAKLAQLEFNYTKKLHDDKVVSQNEVALLEAKLAKAQAKAKEAAAELAFTYIKAPYDGIVDRVMAQQGSLIEEGEILTTLSDNSLMWVYFPVPEADYLEYKENLNHQADMKIELLLANGKIFDQKGKIGAIEADFNNETGNIPFRADFPNPEGILRHGQTGTILVHRDVKDALIIPQRSTFETLDKRYVYVVDKDDVVHQREIKIANNNLEDLFVVEHGLSVDDKIVLEGVRQLREGDKVVYEDRAPEDVVAKLKYHAE